MKLFLFFFVWPMLLPAQTFTSFVERLEHLPLSQRTQAVHTFLASQKSIPIIEEDILLHFIWFGKASMVLVNGNLQHWLVPDTLNKIECEDSAFFYKSFIVPSDARLDYKFVVDGKEQLDPINPRMTPSGFGPHSEARMSKFISSPYLMYADSIPHGSIDSALVDNHIPPPLNHYTIAGRIVKIYLPPGYDTLSHLSSVYVHDGFQAIEFAHLPVILDNLIAQKKIPPVVAVFIPPVERLGEYMTDRRDKFAKALCDEIVPFIDKKYKTAKEPKQRAMMGISAGAYFSLYTVLSRLDIFHNVGAQSAAITPGLIALSKKRANENALTPAVKIYLDCGRYDITQKSYASGEDFLELNRAYSNLLSSLHVPHYYKEVNDGHEWANWRERMPEMLIFFFGM